MPFLFFSTLAVAGVGYPSAAAVSPSNSYLSPHPRTHTFQAATGAVPKKTYPAEYEAAVSSRVTALEVQVLKERKKRRTLMHIKGLLGKRVPQVSVWVGWWVCTAFFLCVPPQRY